MQAYPAMEYRFIPERITVTTDDVVCFVWSGKNKFYENDFLGKTFSKKASLLHLSPPVFVNIQAGVNEVVACEALTTISRLDVLTLSNINQSINQLFYHNCC